MASLAAPAIPTAPLLRARFIATVFAGSFLLFLVQPMIARMALPRLGGAPAVWNSAMLVYQALLLAGYAYAHWLGRLAPRRQAFVHLTLFGLAALTLPLSLIGATPGPGANIFVWVPWLLLVSIGPLFLVVSAQAPLIQRWFALAGGGDPYPLYAASNFGSFLGLVCYPLVVEPLLPVAAQSQMWSIGYGLLALFVIACALMLPRTTSAPVEASTAPRPTRRAIATWIGLAFIPSGLMLSTTLHLTTDIVAMPLLWVVPLGLYLLSYSVAFAANRTPARWITRAAPVILLLVALSVCAVSPPFPFLIALVAMTGLFAVSVALHAMLFDRRPDPSQLTLFYLATSVGGVLGGLFCALIAPLSFDWTYEHPLLLVAAAAVIGGTAPLSPRLAALWSRRDERTRRLTRWLGVASLLLSLIGNGLIASDGQLVIVGAIAISALALIAIGNRPLFAMALAALMLSLGGWDKLALSVSNKMTRSFFGIYMVGDVAGARLLVHGTTTHGVQNLGSPARERMATSYYAPRSGVGLAMSAVPGLFPAARVDIVGLGAGTLGCYGVPGQSWRFFEIDPKVETIARDRFTFLSRCQPAAPVIIGDARLTIDRTPPASADVLVIDAFSSDSVPMHLLTLQAFEVYRRHLRPEGLLMVHISNRYLDLAPVIAAAAAHGWSSAARSYYPTPAEERGRATASQWIALSRSPATVAAIVRASRGERWTRLEPTTLRAWTDDHASILPVIRWKS